MGTLSTEEKIVKLAIQTGSTSPYLSDQLTAKYGTTHISEVKGMIGDTGEPFIDILIRDIKSS